MHNKFSSVNALLWIYNGMKHENMEEAQAGMRCGLCS